jgi:mRNA-degrading endonuclease toxin of MazEF toxin-antitoxin module
MQRPLEATHLFLAQDSPEGRQAGIRLDSVIKAETILTLPKALIHKTLGHLPPHVMADIDRCLAIAVGLTTR